MSALFKKKVKKPPALKLNHHFVFIEASINAVGPEAMSWGEASWWPQDSRLQFRRLGEGTLEIGTQFEMKVKGFMGPTFVAEVTQLIPNRLLELTYRKGFIIGQESIRIEERANGTRIDYELKYRITGLLNVVLWNLFFQKAHDRNLRQILDALKEYIMSLKAMHQERQMGDG